MRFETIDALRHPTMTERPMKLRSRFLQLHSRFQTIRLAGAPAHEAVDFFFRVYDWLSHSAVKICRRAVQRKARRRPSHSSKESEITCKPTGTFLTSHDES
jgi:hypothetical protein